MSSEVADAFASFRVLTQLLACLQGRDFASRALQVNFAGTAVALKFGTDFTPFRFKCFTCLEGCRLCTCSRTAPTWGFTDEVIGISPRGSNRKLGFCLEGCKLCVNSRRSSRNQTLRTCRPNICTCRHTFPYIKHT